MEIPAASVIGETVLLVMGIIYLIIAGLVLYFNSKIWKTSKKKYSWILFFLGIIIIFCGRIDAAALTIIAGMIYILKQKEVKMPKKKVKESTTIIGLIVNLFLPGLGTIIFGLTETGVIQLVLYLVGVFLMVSILGAIVGVPLMLAMWIWALVLSIKTLVKTRK